MVLNLWQQVSATSVAIDWLQRADASQNVQFRNKQNHTAAHTHHNKLHIGNVYYPPSPKSPARQPHTQTYTHIQNFSSFRRTPKEKFQILKEGAVAWEAAENTPATSHSVFQWLNNTSRTPLYADGGARRWKTIRAEDTFSCENKSKGGPVFKMSASVIDFLGPLGWFGLGMTDLRTADKKEETTLCCETKSTGAAIVSARLPGTTADGLNEGLLLSPGRWTGACHTRRLPFVGTLRSLNPSQQPKCIF